MSLPAAPHPVRPLAAFTGGALVLLLLMIGCQGEVTNGIAPPPLEPPQTGPAAIRPISGNNQSAPVRSVLPSPLTARVFDSTSIPIPGVHVTWSIAKGGGHFVGVDSVTDSTGTAKASWQLGDTAGNQKAMVTIPVGTASFSSVASLVLASLTIAPASATLLPGGTQQFVTTGTFSDGSTGAVAVTYSVKPTTGGSIDSTGLFSADSVPGTYSIIVKQKSGTLSDTATVNIRTATATLQSITVSPKSTTVPAGGAVTFTASGKMSDGSTIVPTVFWTVSGGGTIGSASGTFIATPTPGTYTVTATQGNVSGTASVLIPAQDLSEPVYTTGVDGLVYQDGFDNYTYPVNDNAVNGQNHATFPTTAYMKASGTMPASMGGGPYSPDPAVFPSASLDVGRNGSGHSIRSNNTTGTEGGNPQSWGIDWMGPQGSGVVLPTQFAKNVFQYWFKTNPGGGPGNQGNKWFEWWAAGSAIPSNNIRMQVGPYPGAYNPGGGQNPFTVNDQLANIINTHGGSAAQPLGPYFTQVNDGQWHRLTITWLSPTGLATRDGYVRAWLDGTKILDLEQATVGVKPAGGTKAWCTQLEVDAMPSFRVGSFKAFPSHVNSATANWSLWVDDFIWWTEP